MSTIILIMVMVTGLLAQTSEYPDYPGMIEIDALENIFHPVPFAHGTHAEMADMGNGCVVCHHHAEEDIFAPCADCHESSGTIAMPTLNGAYHRNCLSCHREWAADQVCESCHARKLLKRWVDPKKHLDQTDFVGIEHPPIDTPSVLTFETPDLDGIVTFHHEEHVRLYQYQCVDCHREENCSKCHDYIPKEKPGMSELPVHHTPCIQCHDTEDGDCESCHMEEVSTGFTHDLTGFTLKAYHQDGGCNSCHPAGTPVAALDRSCIGCHDNFEIGMFNHAVTGLTLNEDHSEIDCYECHENDDYELAPVCYECHDEDVSYPAQLPGEHN